jgi:hypothetical protein
MGKVHIAERATATQIRNTLGIIRSSYIQNNYAPIFENTTKTFQPHKVVELGVLDGYSTIAIARGLRKAEEIHQHVSQFKAYDLWEDYQYKHGDMEEVQGRIDSEGLTNYVSLHRSDAFEVAEEYSDESVCLLHVDISNDGIVFNRIVEQWHKKLTMGGMLLFEGGSEERDNVDWMKKYDKKPIKPEIESNVVINDNYIYATYLAFPSLSVFIRKN